ncbi:MAG: hypothetical protein V2I51_17860, partial [Anderseniella sp.]|nr:hypothetical protein [Anderseniella sp.]
RHSVDCFRVKQTDCPCSCVQLASAWRESGAGDRKRTQAVIWEAQSNEGLGVCREGPMMAEAV